MYTEKIGQNLYLIDLQTGGYPNLIASYVLKANKTTIVETGPTSSIQNLLKGLEEIDVNPADVEYVAISHVHIDHGGGAGTLIKELPNARVVVHSRGASHLVDPIRLWVASRETLGSVAEMFGEPEPVSESKLIVAEDGLTFDLGKGLGLTIVESPGHASHNLSFFEKCNKVLFTGDAAGAYLPEFDAVFPTTPPPFRADIAVATLHKLINLDPEALCYSHFGRVPDAVARLRGYEEQIKLWLSIVKKSVAMGENANEIREQLFKEDKTVQGIVSELRNNPIHRSILIENSVQGFIEFVTKSESKHLS